MFNEELTKEMWMQEFDMDFYIKTIEDAVDEINEKVEESGIDTDEKDFNEMIDDFCDDFKREADKRIGSFVSESVDDLAIDVDELEGLVFSKTARSIEKSLDNLRQEMKEKFLELTLDSGRLI